MAFNLTQIINKVLKVQSATQDIVFQNAITVSGNGQTLTVGGFKTLLVEIYGTATGGTVNFVGANASGTYTTIVGTQVSSTTMTQSTSTSSIVATPTLWQFDITGLKSVQMQVSAVSGGNITVQGTVVA